MAINNWSRKLFKSLIKNDAATTCLVECTLNGNTANAVCLLNYDHEKAEYLIMPIYIEVTPDMDLKDPDGRSLQSISPKKQ